MHLIPGENDWVVVNEIEVYVARVKEYWEVNNNVVGYKKIKNKKKITFKKVIFSVTKITGIIKNKEKIDELEKSFKKYLKASKNQNGQKRFLDRQ